MNTQTNFQTSSSFGGLQKKIHYEFVRLGRERNKLLNEMLAILPDIYESGIWRKYASSIFEYSGKYGGLSDSAVKKRLRLGKHNHQCAYPACNKPAQHLHHINRWHRYKNHANIIPLCKVHHEFAHNGLVEGENKNWWLNVDGCPKIEADQLYRKYRKEVFP